MGGPPLAAVATVITRTVGRCTRAQATAALQQSAADLSKPGEDEFHGHRFVDALRAVR